MSQLLLTLLAVTILGAGLVVLAAFAAQLVILSLTERRFHFLRWAPLAVPALALYCGILRGSVIEAGLAGALLLGWALGWAAYRFQKRREKP